MKLGLKTLLAAVLAAALVVPAATAKPGNGNGNGQGGGKPSWAGGGKPSSAGGGTHGKPEWAGEGKGHDKKAEKAHKSKGDETAESADTEQLTEPLHDNPAFICRFERDMNGEEAFADKYGTNDNKANAFGKCVSEEAHARDGVSEDVQPEEADQCEPSDETATEADSSGAGGEADPSETAGEADPADADECAAPDESGDAGDVEGTEGDEETEPSEGSEGSGVDAVVSALRLLF
jgi:hypothetical protein